MVNFPYVSDSRRFEKAKRIGHVPIIKSDFIQKKLKDFHIITRKKIKDIPQDLIINLKNEIDEQELPDYIISFDGSESELVIDERFPSTRIGYIQIAAVLIYLNEMMNIEKSPLIDPFELKKTINESIYSIVLPGSNIREKICDNLKDSWRLCVFQLFNESSIENQTLLDIFWDLIQYSGISNPKYKKIFNNQVRLKKCPVNENCTGTIYVQKEGSICPSCNKKIYPIDVLRFQEELSPFQSNIRPLKRLMNLLEHLNLIGYLKYLIERQPEILSKIAFILDGPLALFGPQAWVHRAILNYINIKIFKSLSEKGINYPLVIGLEKTGNFAEHAETISKYLKPQTLMVLTEDYIYNYILSTKIPFSGIYGSETYYGQKFFYKTKTNQILTVTIPLLKKSKLSTDIISHPTLLRSLKLLDRIGTILYKDALIPIALAHSFASIPLGIGSKVLKLLSQEILQK
ncbi:MAG: hypothetical protein ACTSPY_06780 [Candidatus Helarchaeota archaeon]